VATKWRLCLHCGVMIASAFSAKSLNSSLQPLSGVLVFLWLHCGTIIHDEHNLIEDHQPESTSPTLNGWNDDRYGKLVESGSLGLN
jgi:hypothetical protein